MTRKGIAKFMDMMPEIRKIALINREYFEEAERVCELLRRTQPGFYAENLIEYVRKLNLCNYSVLKTLQEIDDLLIQSKVKTDSDDFNWDDFKWDDLHWFTSCQIWEKAKYVCSRIDEFEEARKSTMGMSEFKKYVEPKMAMWYKNLMNDEQSPSNKPESNDNPNETSVKL